MNRFLALIILYFGCTGTLIAQADTLRVPAPGNQQADTTDAVVNNIGSRSDTVRLRDSLQRITLADAVSRRPVFSNGSGWEPDSSTAPVTIHQQILNHHPFFGFGSPSRQLPGEMRKRTSPDKDWLFYLVTALLIMFGFLKLLFPKYFSDLFRLFFRTTIKQRQIKEQLMQTPLPSLLLNAFFVFSAGLYASFMLEYLELNTVGNFWVLFLYCIGGISLIYFIKFAGLKISGWLFNIEEAANAYVFIVFVVNKMMGILLLPVLVLLAFTAGDLYQAGLVLSWCLLGGLLIYRFILTYAAIRNQVKVNPFHFLLYLLAFEIAPLLLIYKTLLLFFRITA